MAANLQPIATAVGIDRMQGTGQGLGQADRLVVTGLAQFTVGDFSQGEMGRSGLAIHVF